MRKIKNKKIYTLIIIGLAVFILAYLLLRSCNNTNSVSYKFEKAGIGEVKKTISVTGTLEVLNSYPVISKINGIVTNIYVDFKTKVVKNQLLATLDTSEIDQEISRIISKKDSLGLELAGALSDLNAKKDMLKDNLVVKKAVDQAELAYKKIDQQFNQTLNDYEIAKKNKLNARIVAPESGVILNKDIELNMPVTANKQLFVIAEDMRKMQLIIHIDESDIGLISNGQSVTFSVSAYPEKTFNGKITQVRDNAIKKDQIVSYEALVTCDNSELKLKPGMTATATVDIAYKEKTLRVPGEAFIVSPEDYTPDDSVNKYVWKRAPSMNSSELKRIKVKTGLVGDYYTEIITDEIKPGDEILIGTNK